MIGGRTHRGVALLLVLGTLVLVASTLGLLTLAAAQGHRSVSLVDDERLLRDLHRSSEPLVEDWLATKSANAVVDPELTEPMVEIASVSWEEGGDVYELSAAAWDLQGMLPAATSSASPLWLSVENRMRELDLGRIQSLADVTEYPGRIHPEIGGFDSSIGSSVAVYPSEIRRGTASRQITPTININTAPRPLLEAALRLAQRGDVASIISARQEGRAAPAPSRSSNIDEGAVRLTGRSTLWAVRVDASLSGMTRSWWTVYESRRGGWEILERHAISE